MVESAPKEKYIVQGTVTSDKMDKTIVVKVERVYLHPRQKKTVRTFKKYKVHDPEQKARVGDLVEIYEGRPVSSDKSMYLSRVLPK